MDFVQGEERHDVTEDKGHAKLLSHDAKRPLNNAIAADLMSLRGP